MRQAVHRGALIPATAIAAIGVLRAWPRLRIAQNTNGASAFKLICTYLAVEPSALPESDELVSSPIAPAAVEKYTGSDTVLVNRPVDPPMINEPKLYLFPCPVVSSRVALA